jgi:hypothetical protein
VKCALPFFVYLSYPYALKKKVLSSIEVLQADNILRTKHIFVNLHLFIPTAELTYSFLRAGSFGADCCRLPQSIPLCSRPTPPPLPVLLSTTCFLNSKSQRAGVIIYKLHLARVLLCDSSMAVHLPLNQVFL